MVTIERVDQDGHYYSETTSGPTVKVTLARGNERLSCSEIMIWDPEEADLEELWEEWLGYWHEDPKGFEHWTV